MVDTGYLPFDRPFACYEFFVDSGDYAVFTINCAADFAELAEEFAVLSAHGVSAIDWLRVAEQYHAVHLTFTGLILAQKTPVNRHHHLPRHHRGG